MYHHLRNRHRQNYHPWSPPVHLITLLQRRCYHRRRYLEPRSRSMPPGANFSGGSENDISFPLVYITNTFLSTPPNCTKQVCPCCPCAISSGGRLSIWFLTNRPGEGIWARSFCTLKPQKMLASSTARKLKHLPSPVFSAGRAMD